LAGFYRRPKPEAHLSQGDVFIDVPIIAATFRPLFQVLFEASNVRVEQVDPCDLLDGMLLVEKVQLTTAIIVSQSCDAERAPRLELAPLAPFLMEGKTPEKQWKRISNIATSLHETKSFYLPGNAPLGLKRSVAGFGEMFALPRKLLEELARRGKRIACLSDRAVAYLQFRLNVMRTRAAQDDYAWSSAEDLGIKLAYLDEQIKEQERKISKADTAAQAADAGEKLALEQTAQWLREELTEFQQERARCGDARKAADEVHEAGHGEVDDGRGR
jgi:hypothetical protein